jgi:hypothetical protein
MPGNSIKSTLDSPGTKQNCAKKRRRPCQVFITCLPGQTGEDELKNGGTPYVRCKLCNVTVCRNAKNTFLLRFDPTYVSHAARGRPGDTRNAPVGMKHSSSGPCSSHPHIGMYFMGGNNRLCSVAIDADQAGLSSLCPGGGNRGLRRVRGWPHQTASGRACGETAFRKR